MNFFQINPASVILSLALVWSLAACTQQPTKRQASPENPSAFTPEIRDYYLLTLDSAAHYLSMMDTAKSQFHNQMLWQQSRKWYKRSEPMMMGYDYANYTTVNGPNLLKVEIDDFTDIKKITPYSYQVLEELLFVEEEEVDKVAVAHNLMFLKARLPFMRKNHMLYRQRDDHHLKMIRDAIINIAAKGITGFDSPMLANSLQEAIWNYQSIRKIIEIYQEAFANQQLYQDWLAEMEAVTQMLQAGDFDGFDRYHFIKTHTNRQLELVKATAEDWGISLKATELNPLATNFFGKDFFNLEMFAPNGSPKITPARVGLGKMLFYDERLSKTNNMSCGTCHQQELGFTDGLKLAKGNDGQPLARNTPTLAYSVFQQTFFYDGRGDGLEGQIVSVMNNEKEFHLDFEALEATVKQDESYQASFDTLYGGEINSRNIRHAIATYIRSLAPFDSKFDRNMQGREETLTSQEIKGFNIFMGKAACATCHFPPVFNGVVPPRYSETEFEHLGVPATASFEQPSIDPDPGMYFPYMVEERRHFFKTSTVRNVEYTAPYMHNGVYNTLEEVMTFYNVGGGAGMGLDLPYQTLPPDSLHLTQDEIKAVIAFMKSLSDVGGTQAYTTAD